MRYDSAIDRTNSFIYLAARLSWPNFGLYMAVMKAWSQIHSFLLLLAFVIGYGTGWGVSHNLSHLHDLYQTLQTNDHPAVSSLKSKQQAGQANLPIPSNKNTPSTSQKAQALRDLLNQENNKITQLNEKIQQLENNDSIQLNLEQIEQQIANHPSEISSIEQNRKNLTQQALNQYAQENLQVERQSVQDNNNLNRIQNEAKQVQQQLQQLSVQIQNLSILNVETDALDEDTRQYELLYSKYQKLMSQLNQSKIQAGQSAYLLNNSQDLKQKNDLQAIQTRYSM